MFSLVDISQIDGSANRIVIDYVEMTNMFGELELKGFVILWQAADELVSVALRAGFGPEDVTKILAMVDEPDLLSKMVSRNLSPTNRGSS